MFTMSSRSRAQHALSLLGRRKMSSSVNTEEVEKFARMSATWWDPNGPFRPLHSMNPCRMQFIVERVGEHFLQLPPFSSLSGSQVLGNIVENSPLEIIRRNLGAPPVPMDPRYYSLQTGLDILDVGCGGGLLCESQTRLGARSVTGIDASEHNIAMARHHQSLQGKELAALNYAHILSDDLVLSGRQFDVVTSLEVVEHVSNPQMFVSTLLQLVKPGGLLIMSTLNRTAQSYAQAIITAEQLLKWVPYGTHDWSKFLSPQELERLVWNASETSINTPKARTRVDRASTVTAGMDYVPYPIDAWHLQGNNFDVNYIISFATQK